MAAPKGNQFWRLAADRIGRPLTFETPEELWTHCVEYFEWVDAHPLQEAQAFSYQGKVKLKSLPKMRAMTITALCLFLGIDLETWADYRNRKEFRAVVLRVDNTIRTQKFEGAAAELLNPNIIARDLGLADRNELTGANGGPIETKDISARDKLRSRVDRLAARKGEAGSTG